MVGAGGPAADRISSSRQPLQLDLRPASSCEWAWALRRDLHAGLCATPPRAACGPARGQSLEASKEAFSAKSRTASTSSCVGPVVVLA